MWRFGEASEKEMKERKLVIKHWTHNSGAYSLAYMPVKISITAKRK
jgi:hypothetical protein